MMQNYESEQVSLKDTIRAYEKLLTIHTESADNIKRHVDLVEQYLNIRKLDACCR